MIRMLLCDDNERHLADTAALLRQSAKEHGLTVAIEAFDSSDALLSALNSRALDPEIAILDIRMGEPDGIALAKRINALLPSCQIIFLTGYVDYAMDVYEADHVRFVLKEKQDERLWPAVRAACERHEKIAGDTVAFCTAGGVELRRIEDVLCFERVERKTRVTTATGTLWVKDPIREMEKKLAPTERFYRCHQSYLVNLACVKSVGERGFLMKNGAVIPVSRVNRKEAQDRFLDFMNAYVLHGSDAAL